VVIEAEVELSTGPKSDPMAPPETLHANPGGRPTVVTLVRRTEASDDDGHGGERVNELAGVASRAMS
jgi:hypothetical protein